MMKRGVVLFFVSMIFMSFFDVKSNEKFLQLIEALKPLDKPLPSSKAGDWLSDNPEPGQTFSQFRRTVVKPLHSKLDKIYIKPIGVFDTNQLLLLKELSSYISGFYQCEVIVQESIMLKDISRKAKRKHDSFRQLNTDYINYRILYPVKPKNAIAYMGITTSDLFPSSNWNFVFGQADQINKVGVSSIARYDYPDSLNFNRTLARIIKTSTHEIGHMLGIEHCISASCLMNGSNGLEESDQQPQTMCSECVVKLAWRTPINLVKRDSLLFDYYDLHDFKEAKKHVSQRLSLLNQRMKK